MTRQVLQRGDIRLTTKILDAGLTRITASSWWTRRLGFDAACYLLDDILIDTIFPKTKELVVRYLSDKELSVIACTHIHEDHVGNCGALQKLKNCPVYIRNRERQWTEGVSNEKKMRFYRRLIWGVPEPYEALEMPGEIKSGRRKLRSIPIPGHSETHVALFDEQSGIVFCGDLFISGGATAVMSHENPYDSIRSLRRIADLKPRRLLNGHGLIMDNPEHHLRDKADKIDETARAIVEMSEKGVDRRRIVKSIWAKGHLNDFAMNTFTQGEFSRSRLVDACIAHAGEMNS